MISGFYFECYPAETFSYTSLETQESIWHQKYQQQSQYRDSMAFIKSDSYLTLINNDSTNMSLGI